MARTPRHKQMIRIESRPHVLQLSAIDPSDNLANLAADNFSILVEGIPPFYYTNALSQIFSVFGPVRQCIFPDALILAEFEREIQYRRAIIVFENEQDRDRALSHTDLQDELPAPDSDDLVIASSGLDRYMNQYRSNRPDPAQLLEAVDEFMSVFDAESNDQSSGDHQVDEDGFTLVTSSGKRRRRILPKVAGLSLDVDDSSRKRKSSSTEESIEGFYRTSKKATRKFEEIASLREKFNSDRSRLRGLSRKGVS
jgi:hypothetical protein